MAIWLIAATVANAQKWDELSDEQKLTKLKSFRADNQKYLKESFEKDLHMEFWCRNRNIGKRSFTQ